MTSQINSSSAKPQESKPARSVQLIGPPLPVAAERLRSSITLRTVPHRKVAVIVTHGMGSQVPFETLQLIAEILESHAARPATGLPIAVRLAELNGTQLPRAEVEILDASNQPLAVHLYEAYWAPLTEGKVTARDSLWFLFMAGLRGIRSSLPTGKFDRWMFDEWQEFKVHHYRLLGIFALMLLALGSLVLMNVAVGLAAGAYYSGRASDTLASLFTHDLLGFEVRLGAYLIPWLAVPTAASCLAQRLSTPFRRWRWWRWPLRWMARVAWVLALWMTIWTGALVAYQWLLSLRPVHAWAIAHAHWLKEALGNVGATAQALHLNGLCSLLFGSGSFSSSDSSLLAPKLLVALLVTLFLAYAVRWFLREFVGDVAAYVSSYSVSKFDELRNDIQKACLDVMRPVYEQRSGEEFEYDHIVVIGHSLGSVISYDALNALINQSPTQGPLDVTRRTKCIITFGSPLDKTAFIFRTQRPRANEVREALAAAKQPLIQDYAYRTLKWVNLYSPDDWISGKLKFYDTNPCPTCPPAVDNKEDPQAWIPGAAHTSYWRSAMLKQVLYDAVK